MTTRLSLEIIIHSFINDFVLMSQTEHITTPIAIEQV